MNGYRQCGTYIQWNLIQHFKKKKILPFATTQMDLEDIMQGEISQVQKTNTVSSHLYEDSKTLRSRVEWWWPAAGGEGKGEVMVKG